MKVYFGFIFLFFLNPISDISISEKTELSPCPSSPNCKSTQEKRKRKRMKPIEYSEDLDLAKEKLERLLNLNPRAKLIEKDGNYFHYEFKTKIGKFIDDVEFLFDDKTKQLHFRSASKKGWSDMGKNKRRMKKIRKEWQKNKIKTQQKY